MDSRSIRVRTIGIGFFLFVVALTPLFMGNRWDRIHTVDFVQILAAGAILGMTIIATILHFRTSQRAEH